jgi:RNase P/RNase MRP subunit POP5
MGQEGLIIPVRTTRRRYVFFRIRGPLKTQKEIVNRTIPKLIRYNEKQSEGILFTNHNEVWRLRSALAYITKIEDEVSAFQVLKVSGTMRSLGIIKSQRV